MIVRNHDLSRLSGLVSRHPVVGIIGARQVGKTTLAGAFADLHPVPTTLFDLEDPRDRTRLQEPLPVLQEFEGLVVIDEVQLVPDLFAALRVLVDRPDQPTRFLVLGSASPALLRQGAESLAGRIIYHELRGFTLDDVGSESLNKLWFRGGFPRSFLAEDDRTSDEWRQGFIRTFLERDLPQLGIGVAAETMRRFWTMLAHGHGQLWNASELARSFGVSDMTVRNYLDHLTSALVVRQLRPWHENLRKRQVKSPKVYIADSGLLHGLLNLPDLSHLESHPKLGASWEGFVLNEVVSRLGAHPEECYFWATHAGAELDLLVVRGQRLGFEIKRTSAPKVTRSMRIAIEDLKLDRLDVIHAGEHTFPMADGIRAVAAARVWEDLEVL